MLRKDVRTAWNLLHLLDDDYKKSYILALDLTEKYHEPINENYLAKIIHNMAMHELIETKKGVGVRRSTKKIIFMDEVMLAFGVKIDYNLSSPYGKIMLRVRDLVRRVEFRNDKILHKLD